MDLTIQGELNKKFRELSFPFVDGVQDVPFPYGAFGYSTNTHLNTKTSRGNTVYFQLDLYSKYNGQMEVKMMEHEVLEALALPFTLEDDRQAFLYDWNFQTIYEKENGVYHGVLEINLNIY